MLPLLPHVNLSIKDDEGNEWVDARCVGIANRVGSIT